MRQEARPRGRKGGGRAARRFDLGVAKAGVLKGLQAILPAAVQKVAGQPEFDQLASLCLLVFVNQFSREILESGLAHAKRQRLDGYDAAAVERKLRELEEEAPALRLGLSPLYAMVRTAGPRATSAGRAPGCEGAARVRRPGGAGRGRSAAQIDLAHALILAPSLVAP